MTSKLSVSYLYVVFSEKVIDLLKIIIKQKFMTFEKSTSFKPYIVLQNEYVLLHGSSYPRISMDLDVVVMGCRPKRLGFFFFFFFFCTDGCRTKWKMTEGKRVKSRAVGHN